MHEGCGGFNHCAFRALAWSGHGHVPRLMNSTAVLQRDMRSGKRRSQEAHINVEKAAVFVWVDHDAETARVWGVESRKWEEHKRFRAQRIHDVILQLLYTSFELIIVLSNNKTYKMVKLCHTRNERKANLFYNLRWNTKQKPGRLH